MQVTGYLMSSGGGGNKKDEALVKDLKLQITSLQADVARLTVELATMRNTNHLEIEKKELQVMLDMKVKIDEAYDKGFNRCKEQLKELQELQNSMRH